MSIYYLQVKRKDVYYNQDNVKKGRRSGPNDHGISARAGALQYDSKPNPNKTFEKEGQVSSCDGLSNGF